MGVRDDILLGRHKFLTIPLRERMQEYLDKYNNLLVEYSRNGKEPDGYIYIDPSYADYVKILLSDLQQEYIEEIKFRNEQAEMILN